jgi:uncharacterized DUF497 family protein
MINVEWDARKARRVLIERGIDFRDASLVLIEDFVLRVSSPRLEEDRYVGLVEINGKVWAIVHTWRCETLSIITARRARFREEQAFRDAVSKHIEGTEEPDRLGEG